MRDYVTHTKDPTDLSGSMYPALHRRHVPPGAAGLTATPPPWAQALRRRWRHERRVRECRVDRAVGRSRGAVPARCRSVRVRGVSAAKRRSLPSRRATPVGVRGAGARPHDRRDRALRRQRVREGGVRERATRRSRRETSRTAKQAFLEASRADPHAPCAALLARRRCSSASGDVAGAQQQYKAALAVKPDDVTAIGAYAHVARHERATSPKPTRF